MTGVADQVRAVAELVTQLERDDYDLVDVHLDAGDTVTVRFDLSTVDARPPLHEFRGFDASDLLVDEAQGPPAQPSRGNRSRLDMELNTSRHGVPSRQELGEGDTQPGLERVHDWLDEDAEADDSEPTADHHGQDASHEDSSDAVAADGDAAVDALDEVGDSLADHLHEAGYDTIGDVAAASISDLENVEQIGPARADLLQTAARSIAEDVDESAEVSFTDRYFDEAAEEWTCPCGETAESSRGLKIHVGHLDDHDLVDDEIFVDDEDSRGEDYGSVNESENTDGNTTQNEDSEPVDGEEADSENDTPDVREADVPDDVDEDANTKYGTQDLGNTNDDDDASDDQRDDSAAGRDPDAFPMDIESTTERCESCETVTERELTIDLVSEGDADDDRGFDREPYRVSECQECGHETKTRMNNKGSTESTATTDGGAVTASASTTTSGSDGGGSEFVDVEYEGSSDDDSTTGSRLPGHDETHEVVGVEVPAEWSEDDLRDLAWSDDIQSVDDLADEVDIPACSARYLVLRLGRTGDRDEDRHTSLCANDLGLSTGGDSA